MITTWKQEKLAEHHFAQVVGNIGISAHGVSDKLLLSSSYDEIGIDCVAEVVNDLLCVGATPAHMVAYIGAPEDVVDEIKKGLVAGASLAGISISRMEIEITEKVESLVGFGIGVVNTIVANKLDIGDEIVGLPSSGLHTTSIDLAYEILGDNVNLLTPTRMYTDDIAKIRDEGVTIHGLFNLSSISELSRSGGGVDLSVSNWPDVVPQIFDDLKAAAPDLILEELFNMGIGFAVVGPEGTFALMERVVDCTLLGHCVEKLDTKHT